jgi:hypothetical protein
LEGQASALSGDLTSLKALQGQEAADIAQFTDLLADPTAENATKADALLVDLQAFDKQATAAQQDFATKTPSTDEIAVMNAAIKQVQDDLASPTDPKSKIDTAYQTAKTAIGTLNGEIQKDSPDLKALEAQ